MKAVKHPTVSRTSSNWTRTPACLRYSLASDTLYVIISHLRMFAANIGHLGTSGFSFVEYLVNGCRYFPNILHLDT